MSEQIEVKLTFTFTDEGDPEAVDTIQVNDGEVRELTQQKIITIAQLLTTCDQRHGAMLSESSSKAEQRRLGDAKKRQVKKLGGA